MSENPQHPGVVIREIVIPSGMSVKDAAKRLGVGRPALSNLLNGNSSLSAEMAVRLEKAFGADRQKLLDLQARFDRHEGRLEEKTVAVGTYVPPFLTITARDIHGWADRVDARQLLPVLLRRLIHSTGRELRQVDFPGYDNAERHGNDGTVEAGAATPWIPQGKSCWEFGTSQNPAVKAESDYIARLESLPAAERAASTFVFVTPRNWPGKTAWVANKNAAVGWKGVRALDASDLEQWLEQSIPGQIWLAEKLGLPVEGVETLEQFWQRWAAASDPPMPPQIFEPAVAAYGTEFKRWLDGPGERPFVVSADSKDEAMAFLACLLGHREIAGAFKDRAAIFRSAKPLKALASSPTTFMPVVCADEAERELATMYRQLHCIVVRPRNAVGSEPDIVVDSPNHAAFEAALATIGIGSDESERLARESGGSPTILRRRLSKIDAIRTPPWAGDAQSARSLVPMTLIGAWHTDSAADREIISVLAARQYQEIEESVTRLLPSDDCPVWSVGQYRGVASKIDALFAIAISVTKRDLLEFFLLAEYVLSESDPALELPEDKRWAAGMYGKVRDHSAALREGICETLVILSVHGNNLFQARLGIDVDAEVSQLIRRLLTPLTLDKLLSQDRDLPRYAEAAPDGFLSLIEADLNQSEPVVLGLLKPAGNAIFSGCPRTGLLWALECLAWNPDNLPRVSKVLARLSRIRIVDNWMNKPIASLESIYRSWMPQTAAKLDDRAKSLEMLAGRYPDIAWQICIAQFEPGSQTGHYSYRPRWRGDAAGAGQPVIPKEHYNFVRRALDLALAWPKHDERTLGDLVERLQGMPETDQIAVWDLVDAWSDSAPDDRDRAGLRERIRRFAFTRRGRKRNLGQEVRTRARETYVKLEPHDPVIRHAWLFASQWVDESANELEDGDIDFSKREERIDKLRAAAMKEIWTERGFDGIAEILADSGAPLTVGQYAARCVKSVKGLAEVVRQSLAICGDRERQVDGCLQGILHAIEAGLRATTLQAVARSADSDQLVRLYRSAPFGQETWRLVDQHGEEIKGRYWREVYPYWSNHTEGEINELIDRLLEAGRPRAAFHTVHMDCARIETSRLKRLLRAVATTDTEPAGRFQFNEYDLSQALKSLDGRAGVTSDEMAQLEFLFIGALVHGERGIPNLERQVAESPALFMQAMALLYRRSDDGEDPPEWRIDDPERRSSVASAALHLLDHVKRIPGTDRDGNINAAALTTWLAEVRQLCVQYGRTKIGDHCIGHLLSRAPAGQDGIWPCRPVCEALEAIASPDIADGFVIGAHNARGVHWRGEGGAQERELVAKYRGIAHRVRFDFTYVSSVLDRIADSYDREATWQDSRAALQKRLRS